MPNRQASSLHQGRYRTWDTASWQAQSSGRRHLRPKQAPPSAHRVLASARMPEIRVDPLSGLRTIIAPARAERPFAYSDPLVNENAPDPFAEGNESQTPPELYAVRRGARGPGRLARARLPNRYPALAGRVPGAAARRQARPLHGGSRRAGAHEVIVNSRAAGRLARGARGRRAVELAVEVWRAADARARRTRRACTCSSTRARAAARRAPTRTRSCSRSTSCRR